MMFSYLVLLFFVSILNNSFSQEDCVMQDSIAKEDAWDKQLHKDKMKNYEASEPPRNQSCVPVTVHFQLKTFLFNDYEDKFVAKVWTRMIWSDERLTWTPQDYGGVDKMVVHPSFIWTPSMILHNTVDPDYFVLETEECTVFYTGRVLCVPELIYESFCNAKLTDWPYDVQNCSLQFGDADGTGVSRFRFAKRAMSLFPAEFGYGWNVMLMESKEDHNSDIQLSITLTLERQASGLLTILHSSSLVLCILTLTSILMNSTDYVRLGLSCFSLISHFIFLFFIDTFLPKQSSFTPVILFFVRDSIILSITTVLFTIILSKIVKRKTVPFEWVSLVTSKVFDSCGKYLVFPRWGENNSESEDINVKNKEIWISFANILNSLYLFTVSVVYIVLFSKYMPKPPPVDYSIKL